MYFDLHVGFVRSIHLCNVFVHDAFVFPRVLQFSTFKIGFYDSYFLISFSDIVHVLYCHVFSTRFVHFHIRFFFFFLVYFHMQCMFLHIYTISFPTWVIHFHLLILHVFILYVIFKPFTHFQMIILHHLFSGHPPPRPRAWFVYIHFKIFTLSFWIHLRNFRAYEVKAHLHVLLT